MHHMHLSLLSFLATEPQARQRSVTASSRSPHSLLTPGHAMTPPTFHPKHRRRRNTGRNRATSGQAQHGANSLALGGGNLVQLVFFEVQPAKNGMQPGFGGVQPSKNDVQRSREFRKPHRFASDSPAKIVFLTDFTRKTIYQKNGGRVLLVAGYANCPTIYPAGPVLPSQWRGRGAPPEGSPVEGLP